MGGLEMNSRINSAYKSLGIAVAIFLAVAMSVPAFGAGSITWLQIGGVLIIFALALAIIVVPLCIVFYKLFSAEKTDRRDERRAWGRCVAQLETWVDSGYLLISRPNREPIIAPTDFEGWAMLEEARPASQFGIVEADYKVLEDLQGGPLSLSAPR